MLATPTRRNDCTDMTEMKYTTMPRAKKIADGVIEIEGLVYHVAREHEQTIIMAVNSHEALLEALKDAVESLASFYKKDPFLAGYYFGAALDTRMKEAIAKATIPTA